MEEFKQILETYPAFYIYLQALFLFTLGLTVGLITNRSVGFKNTMATIFFVTFLPLWILMVSILTFGFIIYMFGLGL